MELHRFAVIGLSDPTPPRVLMLRYRSTHGLEVMVDHLQGTEPSYETSDLTAVAGLGVRWTEAGHQAAAVGVHCTVGGLPATQDATGRVAVPDGPRRRAEAAIEEFADVLAVAHQCRRTIRSPQTCLALAPEAAGEFGVATALSLGERSRQSEARLLPELCADQVAELMWGRVGGLRLLASALSEESPGGRARELYRLIEAAFGDGIGALKKPLYEFLDTAPQSMNYSKRETDGWVSIRGKVMHGDRYAALDSDVVPFLGRLLWAAYDLLLHKRNWGRKDALRRVGLAMLAGPTGDGSITIFHPAATLMVEFMDTFGVYPTDRRAKVAVAGSGVLVNWPSIDGGPARATDAPEASA